MKRMLGVLVLLGFGTVVSAQEKKWVPYQEKIVVNDPGEIFEATFPSRRVAEGEAGGVIAVRSERNRRTGQTRVRALYFYDFRGEENMQHAPRILRGPFTVRLRFDDGYRSQPVPIQPSELYLCYAENGRTGYRSPLGNILRSQALANRERQRTGALPVIELHAEGRTIPLLPVASLRTLRDALVPPPEAPGAGAAEELARRRETAPERTPHFAYLSRTRGDATKQLKRQVQENDGAILDAYETISAGFAPDHESTSTHNALLVARSSGELDTIARRLGPLAFYIEDETRVADWVGGEQPLLGPVHLSASELRELLTLPIDRARELPAAQAMLKLIEQTKYPGRVFLKERVGNTWRKVRWYADRVEVILGIPRADRDAAKAELGRRLRARLLKRHRGMTHLLRGPLGASRTEEPLESKEGRFGSRIRYLEDIPEYDDTDD